MELNKIYQGDCLGGMRSLPNESVDVIVTSPPYNLREGNTTLKTGGKWNQKLLNDGYQDYQDNLPMEEYISWQRNCLTEMLRLIKPTGAIFYNHKFRIQQGLLQNTLTEITKDFPVRQIIIWKRHGGMNFQQSYFLPTYEVIYLICKPEFKLANKANAHGDVWEIGQERNNQHPAPFPVEIPLRAISSCLHNEIVLDPFMGSGTTAVAAKRLGKSFIGFELSESYIELAKERLKQEEFKSNQTDINDFL